MSDVIGVDLGGTKIAVARLAGRELADVDAVCRPNLTSADALIDQLVRSRSRTAAATSSTASGIGVPSVVDFETGRVVSSVNIPLADVPLREVLGERLGVPVFVDNDATVAALAEAHDDELNMVARDLVMLTIGTGVGGGLVLGRADLPRGHRRGRRARAHAGRHGSAWPGARRREVPPARLAGVGSRRACARWSGRRGSRASIRTRRSAGARAAGEKLTGVEAVEAALRTAIRDAARLIELWGERVGIGVANAINTFDPKEVVIGGGAARAGDLLLEPAKRTAAAYVLPGLGTDTTIRAGAPRGAGRRARARRCWPSTSSRGWSHRRPPRSSGDRRLRL